MLIGRYVVHWSSVKVPVGYQEQDFSSVRRASGAFLVRQMVLLPHPGMRARLRECSNLIIRGFLRC